MPKRKRKPRTAKQKRERYRKEHNKWPGWKRAQRKTKVRKNQVRHHRDGNPNNTSGRNVSVISRKAHANEHKRRGNAGGRPRKKKGKK